MQKDLHDSYSPRRKKFVFLDFPWKTEYTLNCWEILKKKKKKQKNTDTYTVTETLPSARYTCRLRNERVKFCLFYILMIYRLFSK